MSQGFGLPQIESATVIIPAAQIATLFSAPVELIPAQAGKILLVTNIHIRKTAGTAWTTTSSGVLAVGWTGANQFNLFSQAITDTFFGAAESVWVGEAGNGSFASLGATTGSYNNNGTAVKLSLATANISGGTGVLIVTVWYRVWAGV